MTFRVDCADGVIQIIGEDGNIVDGRNVAWIDPDCQADRNIVLSYVTMWHERFGIDLAGSIEDVEASYFNMVPKRDGCPKCGERDVDNLIWPEEFPPDEDTDLVNCVSCGHQYKPIRNATSASDSQSAGQPS